jgi:hypothetical protein
MILMIKTMGDSHPIPELELFEIGRDNREDVE